ncbi:MAG: alpha amylase C-terminal domain-containing protein, partial [bacterium]
ENFVLPLSHDEVTHGKGSLLSKMPGDEWQQFANLRLLFGYLYTHPGKKLLFMGGEFGQRREWDHESSLEWHVIQYGMHHGILNWVRDLNHFYKNEPALYELDCDQEGYDWVDFNDWENSVVSYIRRGKSVGDILLIVCNFTPTLRYNYRIGVPVDGFWRETLNSDSSIYGGCDKGNLGGQEASYIPFHGMRYSLSLTLPPLGILALKKEIR